MESAKIYTYLVTIVIVIIVIKGFRLKGCFQGHSIYNNKYIYYYIYYEPYFHPKCLMTFMTMTIMTTSVPKIKNGMYIDFVEFFSKKFVNRNENVVPLQTYSDGENRAQRPMHKFSSADENFSQLSIIRSALVTLLQRRQPTKRIINYQLTT